MIDTSTNDLCIRAVQGHVGALHFLDLVTHIAHVWDDLQDKDQPVAATDINKAFWDALIELPRNAFYIQHFNALNTVLSTAILNWLAANELEATDKHTDKEIAFIIRSAYIDLVILCALLVGGKDWAQQVTPELHRQWHSETFAGYMDNLSKEKCHGTV